MSLTRQGKQLIPQTATKPAHLSPLIQKLGYVSKHQNMFGIYDLMTLSVYTTNQDIKFKPSYIITIQV